MAKIKTTFCRIIFGFNKNKLGGSKFYRRGEGADLADAIQTMFDQRGNNWMPDDQIQEVLNQINVAGGNKFKIEAKER